ncbi:MAG: DUF4363 family protein [Ruminococcus sp.]|nr:DUF4363 family protein [Ruminococcus sp.]
MKRFVISVILLAAIIFGSITSLFVFDRKNDEMTERISYIQTLYKQNKTDEAEEELARLDRFWNEYYNFMSFIVQSTKLEEISLSVSKLEYLLKMDSEEFLSECDSIKYGIQMIYDSEFPYLHSIF